MTLIKTDRWNYVLSVVQVDLASGSPRVSSIDSKTNTTAELHAMEKGLLKNYHFKLCKPPMNSSHLSIPRGPLL